MKTGKLSIPRRAFLIAESLALFVVLPLALLFMPGRLPVFLLLWGAALYAPIMLWREGVDGKAEWRGKKMSRRFLTRAAAIFAGAAVLMAGLTLWLQPGKFFAFPVQRPETWALVMVLYPFLSALPQEILFRSFFFRRAREIGLPEGWTVILSALAYAFSHLLFRNPVAFFLSLAAGFVFALHYRQHRSLKKVWLEHALYGCAAFTIGLGYYFYMGAWR